MQRAASKAEVKRSYRKAAWRYHPDRNADDAAAEERFKEAAEAYSVLGDEEKRSNYDRCGEAGLRGGQGVNADIFADFSDIVGDLFGFGGGFASSIEQGGQFKQFEKSAVQRGDPQYANKLNRVISILRHRFCFTNARDMIQCASESL